MESVPHPYGLTVAGGYIYWTDWKLGAVLRADKISGENQQLMREGLGVPMDIHAVDMGNKGQPCYPLSYIYCLSVVYIHIFFRKKRGVL